MDIAAWLRELGLERYERAFRENEIDAAILPKLTSDDLREIGVAAIGHRRRLLDAIAALTDGPQRAPASTGESAPIGVAVAARPAEAERRQLTVLFCDLVGSTELSGRLDPEDLREVMREYQAACGEVIGRFDGHIAKFMGDGALAYFGWPRAHEDDAERAVRAGLALVEAVARLPAGAGTKLAARAGIATGQVVVGDLISQGTSDRDSVSGDAPNLAARLQALAGPGAVIMGEATRRLVGGLFELDDLGPQRLKGFAEPLAVWRVAGEGRAEGRFEARQTAGLTPLVGRAEEISLLLRRWQQAKDGEGQVVLLSGEPGIGKSRLVRELRARLEGEPHLRLTYQCSPYHTSSPLHPLIEQLERAVGFEREDAAAEKLDKLEALLARGTEKLDEAVPLVAALLGVPGGDRHPLPVLTPQRQKQRTLEVLVDQLQGLSAEQPVLLVYEDVHWIDPTTQELLGLAIERIQRLPVLAIVTFRPEFAPPWTGLAHLSSLALTRLGRREGATLVDRVAGAKALPAEVSAQLVRKTDGVPLFVEELTKTVLESGLLKDAGDRYELTGALPPLAIPATLHDSLLARLDRLAPVKEIAQIGATIGHEFSHALLAAVVDRPEAELQSALGQLVSSELIFRRGTPPEASYSFKHALVQDAAYGTLLKSRRQQLHARIAEILERRFPETANTQPELLAHHCTEAGLLDQAISYWRRAGEQAVRRAATLEAIRRFRRALDLLGSQPEGRARAADELKTLTQLGPALMLAKGWADTEVETVYQRASELARQLESSTELVPPLVGLWLFYLARGRFDAADETTSELFQIAKASNDRDLLLQAHHAAWPVPMLRGTFATANQHIQEGLSLYDYDQHKHHAFLYMGHDPAVCAHSLGVQIVWALGFPEQAGRHAEAALELAQRLGHPPTRAFALWFIAGAHAARGDWDAALSTAEDLFRLSEEQKLMQTRATALVFGGWALAQSGQAAEGVKQARAGLADWHRIGVHNYLQVFTCLLAESHMRAGQYPEALECLAQAGAVGEKSGERWWEARIHQARGQVLLCSGSGNREAAAESLHTAIHIARAQAARSVELRASMSLARLWAEQGRRSEGHALLAPAYGWFTEGFNTADLKDAKALLDELR